MSGVKRLINNTFVVKKSDATFGVEAAMGPCSSLSK